jgi:3-hydroxyisobutyrate dehydrogenase
VHSTVSPDLVRRLAQVAAPYGVSVVDSGVSPGGPTIGEGKSSIFVGGDDEGVARARPYLEAFGTVTHLGSLGRGLEGKLLNNLMSTAGYGLSVAILRLAQELGFDEEALRQALMGGSAQSYALMVTPGLLRPSGHGATGSLMGLHDLLRKDVDHAMELAGEDNPSALVLRSAAEAMLGELRRRAGEEGQ